MTGELSVTIGFGQHLKNRDWVLKQDPYCLIFCGAQEVRSRTCHGGGRNPVWNETFIFQIVNENEMFIKVKDHEMLHDELVGEGIVSLVGVRACGREVQQVPMIFKGQQHGFLEVSLAFRACVAQPAQVVVEQRRGQEVVMNQGYGGQTVVMDQGYGRRNEVIVDQGFGGFGTEVIVDQGFGRRNEVIVDQGFGGFGTEVIVDQGFGSNQVIVDQGFGGFGGGVIVDQGFGGQTTFIDNGFGGDVIVEERRW